MFLFYQRVKFVEIRFWCSCYLAVLGKTLDTQWGGFDFSLQADLCENFSAHTATFTTKDRYVRIWRIIVIIPSSQLYG